MFCQRKGLLSKKDLLKKTEVEHGPDTFYVKAIKEFAPKHEKLKRSTSKF